MFQGIVYPLFFEKEKENLALTIQVHHWRSILPIHYQFGEGGGVGGIFLRLDERPSVQATQNKQKWIFFGHKLCGSFMKNPKGKKTRGHLIFEEIWLLDCHGLFVLLCTHFGYLKHMDMRIGNEDVARVRFCHIYVHVQNDFSQAFQ